MRYFDALAPVYDLLMPSPDPRLWRELLRLPAPGALLDAGGGTARISASLLPLSGPVVIVDVSAGMLRRARRKGNLQPVQADVARLPFPDGAFSRVVVADALHHFPSQDRAIGELMRVLAPGGRLVIEEFDLGRLPVKGLALLEKSIGMGSRFLAVEEICGMVQARGTPAVVRRSPPFWAWIIADKPA